MKVAFTIGLILLVVSEVNASYCPQAATGTAPLFLDGVKNESLVRFEEVYNADGYGQSWDYEWERLQSIRGFFRRNWNSTFTNLQTLHSLKIGDQIEIARGLESRRSAGSSETIIGARHRFLVEKYSDKTDERTFVLIDVNTNRRVFVAASQLLKYAHPGYFFVRKQPARSAGDLALDQRGIEWLKKASAGQRPITLQQHNVARELGFTWASRGGLGTGGPMAIYDSLGEGDEILFKSTQTGEMELLVVGAWKYGVREFFEIDRPGKAKFELTPNDLQNLVSANSLFVRTTSYQPQAPVFDPNAEAENSRHRATFNEANRAASYAVSRNGFAGQADAAGVIIQAGQLAALDVRDDGYARDLTNIRAVRGLRDRKPYVPSRILIKDLRAEGGLLDLTSLHGQPLTMTLHGTVGSPKKSVRVLISPTPQNVYIEIPVANQAEAVAVFDEITETAYGQLIENYGPPTVVDHRMDKPQKEPGRMFSKWNGLYAGYFLTSGASVPTLRVVYRVRSYRREGDLIRGLIWGHDLRR